MCQKDGYCIKRELYCDKIIHCLDGSDEREECKSKLRIIIIYYFSIINHLFQRCAGQKRKNLLSIHRNTFRYRNTCDCYNSAFLLCSLPYALAKESQIEKYEY